MTEPELQLIEGKYEILRKLREGGMGAVYKVRHRLLDEIRVIKVIRPHLSGDEGLRRRFLREARAAVRLRHPNIAQLYDFTVDDGGTANMVMEFIDGEDLGRLLKRRQRLAPRTALEIGVQALRALYYLHRSQVVHRDISPDNLMVGRDLDGKLLVKLIDLGIAKPLKSNLELTQQDLFLGKVRYTSPEQLGGAKRRAEVGPRSDLYALGVVLYEITTGVHPIEGDNHEAIIAGHLFHAPRDFTESDAEGRLPPSLRAVLRRSLEKLPDARFADAVEFAAALEAAMTDCDETEETSAELLEGAEGGSEGPEEPTSIQEHLDREFAPEPTQAPRILEPADLLCERIESLLAAGRLGRAEEDLKGTAGEVRLTPRLAALARRLEEAHAQADQQLATARAQRDQGKLEEALR
ncbi:MAG: serine/threonine-protein kinase, partial [Thermoanaerobaculia bacterium]